MKIFLFCVAVFGLTFISSFNFGAEATADPAEINLDAKVSPDGYSAAEQAIIEANAEKHGFEAEVGRLMSIIINSLYVDNEVFLRELISNGSDALDKIRFLSLTDKAQLDAQPDLKIEIKADPEAGTLSITDTGIGMTRDDLINNLGSIAKSGTREFLEKAHSSEDSSGLIGQFGVGFYSAFLVADRVTVTSKHNDSPTQWVWSSTAESEFEIFEDPKGNTLGRGSRITLHLKEDALHFMEQDTIKQLVGRYSSFINFPISLWASHDEEFEEDIPADELEAKEDAEPSEDGIEVTEEDDEEDLPKTRTVTRTVWDWERLNDTKPLWVRSKDDISQDEYNEFYKAVSKDRQDPMAHIHFKAEGEIDFKALLYVPKEAPAGMFDGSNPTGEKNVKLYVRRVFITDEFDDIIPKYLAFLRGVVDSDDLPLNVSRETLQHHKTLKIIKKKLVRKAIAMIQDLFDDDAEAYQDFWKQYATNIKLGVIEDTSNRTRLSKLLMFHSSVTGELSSFDQYVGRMKDGQEQIYMLACDSAEDCQKSPMMEKLNKKGYEVLFMTEAIDEYTLQNIPKFDGEYKITNIAREDLKFDGLEEDEEAKVKLEEEYDETLTFIKDQMKDKLEKVVLSNRLTTSPVTVVSGRFGYTATMEKIMKAQALADPNARKQMNTPKKIMEVNPRHPILLELKKRVAADPEDEAAKVTARVLYETGMISSGFGVDDANDYSNWVHRMMQINLGVDADAVAEEEPEYVPPPVENQADAEEEELHEEL